MSPSKGNGQRHRNTRDLLRVKAVENRLLEDAPKMQNPLLVFWLHIECVAESSALFFPWCTYR